VAAISRLLATDQFFRASGSLRTTPSPEQGDAQRYLLDNAYVIPIFEEPQVFAGAPWLKGVNFEAVGRPSFYGAWIEKH
jgi:MarR-like DNA-binding transcriptional regulator SgrR of sgrS sRNA